MADYWGHWLKIGQHLKSPPKIFRVNWFRTGDNGKFLWPGFSDNLRVLKWILERSDGTRGGATDTPIGDVPTRSALDLRGLDISDASVSQLLDVDPQEWSEAVQSQEKYFESFGPRLPRAIREEHDRLAQRIDDAVTPSDLRGRDSGT
jgi:phosphoenolpyruvate carboxykinase (GTP)